MIDKRGNKKGQALSMQTIIIIILAIVVLVFIVLHFTGGLQQLWGRIIGEYSQRDIEAARIACGYKSVESFCTEPYSLYNQRTKEYKDVMCYDSPLNVKLRVDNETITKSDCLARYPVE